LRDMFRPFFRAAENNIQKLTKLLVVAYRTTEPPAGAELRLSAHARVLVAKRGVGGRQSTCGQSADPSFRRGELTAARADCPMRSLLERLAPD
jgi:hypothetical protein